MPRPSHERAPQSPPLRTSPPARALLNPLPLPRDTHSDLARFIAAGRLSCTIDRVSGIVETHRPDAKNARYAAVIKQGDAVLTSVQRLSRVIG